MFGQNYNDDDMTEMHHKGYELGYERARNKYELELEKVKEMLKKRVDPAKILKAMKGE